MSNEEELPQTGLRRGAIVSSNSSLESSASNLLLSSSTVNYSPHPGAFQIDAAAPVRVNAPVPIMPSSAATTPTPNTNTVAEFLYQLTKMLTDDNREIIEWANGKIEVHHPKRLESEVLNRYFRHSKFASFQRQLNYFGFRKLAGKGKMAPCSYVNEAATEDLSSLLLIKRKAGPTQPPRDKNASRKRERDGPTKPGGQGKAKAAPVNPVLAGILQRNRHSKSSAPTATLAIGKGGVKHQLNGYLKKPVSSQSTHLPAASDHKALARAAAGKGVRHGYVAATLPVPPAAGTESSSEGATGALASVPSMSFQDIPQLGNVDIQASLSELTNNYRNSLGEAAPGGQEQANSLEGSIGFLSRESSLLNLAMLPMIDSVEPTPVSELQNSMMPFVDFPNQEMDPSLLGKGSSSD